MKNSWIPIEFLARIVSTYLRNITTAVLKNSNVVTAATETERFIRKYGL